MLALIDQVKEPLVATDEEAIIAKEAANKLKALSLAGMDLKLRAVESADIVVPLPARAIEMIVTVLTAMAERKAGIRDSRRANNTAGRRFLECVATSSG